ncbi:uncharacterized protein LOC112595048 [Melanaphis sacchari]|uniref:uncharacterized protein LOC112595048 n=1 Tax=Melanaphis sacchari TaxID=742174 RepID=UPI000DC14D32|nr:uncharacterized protein LOC112595048 [Melanaphis sacchari]
MKSQFIIYTAVTVLQVFDVFINGISAAKIELQPGAKLDKPNNELAMKPIALKSKITIRSVKQPVTFNQPDDSKPEINLNNVDSDEAEPPTTIKESGRRVVKTAKKLASKRGANLFNGITGLMKRTDNTIDFFGKFVRDRANNVKDVAKESFGLLSGLSNSSTNGAKNVISSAKVIGNEGSQVMYSTLQKSTNLGKNLTKLGGTVITTPISIGENVVTAANGIARIPSRLSRKITNGGIKPLLNAYLPDSDENTPENEIEEKIEEENIKPPPTVKAPPTLQNKRKIINKKQSQ